jgi:hypothetical protein
MEQTWRLLPGGPATTLAPKMPHLSLADALFIGAVASIPAYRRPWGAITWLADVFAISRVSVYALAERIKQRLAAPAQSAALPAPRQEPSANQGISVPRNRLARTILTATFPGNVSIRPTQEILAEALDQRRSIGWISQFRLDAGRQAGQVLRQIDTSPLGPLIVIRDETFFHGQPILIVIDPVSTTILLAEVCADRQADTWGLALLLAQDQGATIVGLVEDMARFYPKSQQLADMADVAVQKDPWHVQRAGSQVRRDLERAAYRAMATVLKLEQQLTKAWDDTVFAQQYLAAVAKEAQLIAQHDSFAEWLSHLHDAFELVDWRSGEIRDPNTAAWLLEETLTALSQIEQPRVCAFIKTLRKHQPQLLTFLDWTAAALAAYRSTWAQQFPHPLDQQGFERTVARHWRLRQALINGHHHWQREATQAHTDWLTLVAGDPDSQQCADQLMQLLDGAGHTSSLVECINGLLKSFLNNRQGFRSPQTLQAYLDLFVLWHNMRVYQRGKRQGQSPYQIAGIDPGADDWLERLGYPAR